MVLNEQKVKGIKAELTHGSLTQREIAEKYGCSRSMVSDIATGRAWTEVEPDPTEKESRIAKLMADNEHLREERNAMRRQLRVASRDNGLFQAIADDIERLATPLKAPPVPELQKLNGRIDEHLVMHLSDGHHDQIIRPEECGGLENHSFPVALARGERWIDTTIKWTQSTLAPSYCFNSCTVLAYGDHTCGEIHGAVSRSYFKNQFKNSLAIGQFHGLMFRDLATYFPRVYVVYVPGNHGRRSRKKDYHGAHDNWDYLVARIAAIYCSDLPNVSFTIPNSFSANVLIDGVGFRIVHGDDIQSSMGIPWYGLERQSYRLLSIPREHPIKYNCCGHFHRPGTISTGGSGKLLINGPWVATDAYAYEKFAAYTEPCQLIHGVNKEFGITWGMEVQLRSEDELKGPKRYKIANMGDIE